MKLSKGLIQAYAVQDITFSAIQAWKRCNVNDKGEVILPEFAAQTLAQLVGAWDKAQDRVRIQRKTPLPGVMKPEPKRKATQPAPITVLEPISADDAPITDTSGVSWTKADVSTDADSADPRTSSAS